MNLLKLGRYRRSNGRDKMHARRRRTGLRIKQRVSDPALTTDKQGQSAIAATVLRWLKQGHYQIVKDQTHGTDVGAKPSPAPHINPNCSHWPKSVKQTLFRPKILAATDLRTRKSTRAATYRLCRPCITEYDPTHYAVWDSALKPRDSARQSLAVTL